MDNPSKMVWKSPTTPMAKQYECEVTCSWPGCTQTEVALFDEASVELLERGRFYHRCKNHLPD
jgi:hypothetical protein